MSYKKPTSEQLRVAAAPLIEFLNEHYHPHAQAIVTTNSVEILEGLMILNEQITEQEAKAVSKVLEMAMVLIVTANRGDSIEFNLATLDLFGVTLNDLQIAGEINNLINKQ